MKIPVRISARAWLLVPLFACIFIVCINVARTDRSQYVTGLAGGDVAIDRASPTGYVNGWRRFIVPEHNNRSYEWIAQTQQMVADGPLRLRHVSYDNTPDGREVLSASVYRWWLGILAWIDHSVSTRPLGVSVERAALFADPLLHLLLLIASTAVAAKWFGRFPAALLSIGLATVFPFAGSFFSGQPDDYGLLLGCALWSVLPLVASADATNNRQSASRRFFVAGVAGGLGMWIGIGTQLPIILGIAVGAIGAAWFGRSARPKLPADPTATLPWRIWATSGAATTLVAFVIEFFPAHMGGWKLETVHPLHALGWWGGGELLARTVSAITHGRTRSTRRDAVIISCAALAFAAVPIVLLIKSSQGFMAPDLLSRRLTNLPNGVEASTFADWISRDGFNAVAFATCLPLLLLAAAGWLISRPPTDHRTRSLLIIGLGPAVVALTFAFFQLRWWNALDVVLLALIGPLGMAIRKRSGSARWYVSAGVALVCAPGMLLLIPRTTARENAPVTTADVEALVERDLAHWLANRSGPGRAAILASPNLTASLIFHGGLRGVGTPYRENKAGLAAAIRIARITTQDDAMAQVQRRQLTHIVLVSWDPFLDEYARLASTEPENSLVALLQNWTAPRWLRPIPYTLPNIPGFEQESVKVFEVVELQDNATALSRLAECFLELRQAAPAASVSEGLERAFPDDFGALVTRAMVWSALGNNEGFAKAFDSLLRMLANKADQDMLFDRRVSLAIVLADGKRFELAQEQVRKCLAELDDAKLRSLTTLSLYRLHRLFKVFGLEIDDPSLRDLSVKLLPAEMRNPL